ncbi:mitochondrial large ribosomal subunit assembly, partial [Halocaridina rubra]
KFITNQGHPVTVSQKEKQQLFEEWSRPPLISIAPSLMEEGRKLLHEFENNVLPYIESKNELSSVVASRAQEESEDEEMFDKNFSETDSSDLDESGNQEGVLNLLTGRTYEINPENNPERSEKMYHSLCQRLSYSGSQYPSSKPLPINEYKDVLQRALEEHQVVVVAGDTGCGKSTQVPQMILDQWILEQKGAECNILISQPRRISAISLAKYVAHERGERLGESVGYHVRLKYKRIENPGGIMFLTTGMLLQGLHSNPSLEGVTHVIVDEVHERSVQTDILLILLRRLLDIKKNLKVILMSASLSTEELQKYFGKDQSALIKVPGALYPLRRYYLEDVFTELDISPKRYQLQSLMEPGSHAMINVDLVVDVIQAIDVTRMPGAVLCFLPGWQDISVVQMRLQEIPKLRDRLWILPLHSRLASSDQEQIFHSPPKGQRKVVLATNIAETSLTIEDVVYVVDTGFHKEHRYDARKDLSVLGNHWISRANSQQRAGRAGRVQAGDVFHLYSSDIHKNMSSFPVPEIMRISLEHVVLQCKAYCGEESALTFLSDGLSVPSYRLIAAAIDNLEDLGMLRKDYENDIETLTPLGRRVLNFSTPPPLSKALVFSSIFRCVDPVLSISAALSSGRGIFQSTIEKRSEIREIKSSTDPSSDLLALIGLIRQWEELGSYRNSIDFCNERNLSHRGLLFNSGIKKVYGDHLKDGLLVDEEYVCSHLSKWNMNSHNNQLILGVLLAGVNRILLIQMGAFNKGILRKHKSVIKNEEGTTISTGSDCVLHTIPKKFDDSSRHLLCIQLTRDDASRRTVARDLSLLHPLTVALFAGHALILKNSGDGYTVTVDGRRKISFSVDERTGEFLTELRGALDQMVNIIIETRGLDMPLSPYFDNLSDKLVQYVSALLEVTETKDLKQKSILHDVDEVW